MNQCMLENLCRQNQAQGIPRLVLVDLDTSKRRRNNKRKRSRKSWEPHPLLEPVILKNLLECVDTFQDLKNIRQVCKAWYDASLKKWRSVAIVRLGPSSDSRIKGLEWSPNLCQAWDVEDYLQIFHDQKHFSQLNKHPYTKYILKGLYLFPKGIFEVDTEASDIQKILPFWNSIGPLVVFIRFENCTFPGNTFEIFEMIINDKLTNLKEITLKECSTFPERATQKFDSRLRSLKTYKESMRRNFSLKTINIYGELPMCLYLLLMNSPNVEKLKIRGSLNPKPKIQYPQLLTQTFNLGRFRQKVDSTPFNLKALDLDLKYVPCGTNQNWQDLNLQQLISVSVIISPQTTVVPSAWHGDSDILFVLRPIVLQHANTLQTLKVVRPPIYNLVRDFKLFPREMPKLENLSISGNLVRNFDFLEEVPSLKSLSIDFQCLSDLDEIKPFYKSAMQKSVHLGLSEDLESFSSRWKPISGKNMVSFEQHGKYLLTRLKHLFANIIFSDQWSTLAGWMPNLKILVAPLTNIGFQNVCKHMPQLEELTLYYQHQVREETLTGITSTESRKTRNPDNITALTRLKKFVQKMLCPPDHIYTAHFGDQSVYKGFLQLTNLKEIVIYAAPLMSTKAERALKRHVEKSKVIRIDSMTDHITGHCCEITYFIKNVWKP